MLTAFTGRDGTLHRITEPLSDALWIDLLEPTPDEAEQVARETGLATPTEADINEIESSSRLATRDYANPHGPQPVLRGAIGHHAGAITKPADRIAFQVSA